MFRFLTLAIFTFASNVAAQDLMEFKLAPDTPENNFVRMTLNGGQYEIFASGQIDTGATERFVQFVRKNSIDDAIVIFNSPGGSLIEGVKLGKEIRAMNFNTAVGSYDPKGYRAFQGVCASSCSYAFAGGVYRFFNGEKEQLGIHQFYSDGDNKGDIGHTQLVSSVLIDYLQSMDVDPKAFVLASTARSDNMVWLTKNDAVSLGLANNGSSKTTAEIKMNGLDPYLKLEQVHSNVVARVLFGCYQGRITVSAGIVTTPELSSDKHELLTRSYFEIPQTGELLAKSGSTSTAVAGSVLWLNRLPSNTDLIAIITSDELGIWTENGGPMRWGAMIDLRPAREKMVYFAKNCLQ